MKERIKVSIIIPVYNGAEFLRRSFDSCIYQTLSDIEVIAVNDCSPNERDAEIMFEYEKFYPNKFRALFHKENKRQGGARNTGLLAAKGEYFLCVDQDDFIASNMCEKMYETAKTKCADLCMCGYNYLEHGEITYCPPLLYEAETLPRQMPTVWKLLVKKSFVTENNIYFPENVVSDDVVSILWFALTDNYCTISDAMYNWVRHDASESHSEPYRYCQTLPSSFIQFSYYDAYKKLSSQKKAWINVAMAVHLYYAARVSIEKLPDKILENCRLIVKALDVFKPEYTHEVFSKTMYGKLYSQVLQYIYLHIDDDNFTEQFIEFHNELKAKLEVESITQAIERTIGNRYRGVTVWGAGIRGKRLCEYLIKAGILFEVTDANPSMYGKIICSKVIKPWSELKNKTDLVIVSPIRVFEAVKKTIGDECIDLLDFRDLMR